MILKRPKKGQHIDVTQQSQRALFEERISNPSNSPQYGLDCIVSMSPVTPITPFDTAATSGNSRSPLDVLFNLDSLSATPRSDQRKMAPKQPTKEKTIGFSPFGLREFCEEGISNPGTPLQYRRSSMSFTDTMSPAPTRKKLFSFESPSQTPRTDEETLSHPFADGDMKMECCNGGDG